jgi:hypothetical protein
MLEIISGTKGKRSGVAGWNSQFITPKVGRYIGYFFAYAYFPSSLAAISVFAGDLLLDAFYQSGVQG